MILMCQHKNSFLPIETLVEEICSVVFAKNVVELRNYHQHVKFWAFALYPSQDTRETRGAIENCSTGGTLSHG